ncbi:MAG: bifunctional folylpolyglutamate synthase/dihydrofolate synthase [Chloroflexi bacterium]|nr:MAG: bifunctional folylpolyglutamate synthase/dihydrofolate synthase [Chloroflexota bacterium]RLC97393.1 MAG: bifunctional folylpolyglutamate synthase/dihydrofolate synthase [Chloroflexota bacterium]
MAEMNLMDFQGAVDYVLSFADYERLSRSAVVFDLARIEALLHRSGDPHLAARAVHVAGTKGKGSTSAMIATALTASGHRTGLYTSPHLHTIRERIQIDGSLISERAFAGLVARLRPHIEYINRTCTLGELTTFEILTAMAFSHFEERAVDFQVLETGLGGRLDATNVIRPEVCVITSISLDHTEVLGDTIAQIAVEKAGIIKPGTPVVCAPQVPEAASVIEEVCHDRESRLIRVGHDVTWKKTGASDLGQSFRVKGTKGSYDLTVPLLGEHQLENAAAAVAALEVLAEGTGITPDSIARGLAQVRWPGRLQVMRTRPLFVVDGAHNADSVEKLKQSLRQSFAFDDSILIVGASRDKNITGIVAGLAPFSRRVIVTQSEHPRAAEVSTLAQEFSKWGIEALIARDTDSAIRAALREAKPTDLICVTGSLFVVSEALRYFGRPAQPGTTAP